MNILMLGNKESGKTTYMVSAFGLLSGGINGFYIRTEDTVRSWFKRLFSEIRAGVYPSATDKRRDYNFTLYHNQNKVLDFNWIDYNGGVITDASVEELTGDIENAEGVMIFLEARALWENNVSEHRFRRILALIFNRLENSNLPLFSLIIVLTKFDQIPKDVTQDKVTECISGFLESVRNADRIYTRVIPVSCTSQGFCNVEIPLLDILDSGMRIEYTRAVAQAQLYAEKAQDFINDSGPVDWIFSRLAGVRTNGEIATEFVEAMQERARFFQSLETPIQNLAQYIADYSIIMPNAVDVFGRDAPDRLGKRFIEL